MSGWSDSQGCSSPCEVYKQSGKQGNRPHPPPDCLSQSRPVVWGSEHQRSHHTVCWERPTSLAKLSSPSERVLSTCVDRGERSRPSRRWWSERGGTAKKLN
jgi:hypothetical protein